MKKLFSIILASLFLLTITLGITGYIFLPQKTFSENENRMLSDFPVHSTQKYLSGWFDKSLSFELDGFFSDRIPMRDALITLRSGCELGLSRGEVNGVITGRNGQLAQHLFDVYVSPTRRIRSSDIIYEDHIRAQLGALKRISVELFAEGIPVFFLPAPRVIDIVSESIGYPSGEIERLDSMIREELSVGDAKLINPLDTLRDTYNSGEYVYFRTDHHWTAAGAYISYCQVMQAFGMGEDILPRDSFSIREVDGFVGTIASRLGITDKRLIASDTLEIWEGADDLEYEIKDKGGNMLLQGFIDEKYLSSKDKYGAFLGGVRGFVTVTKKGETQRPRLLIAKDSFANSMVPFLSRHFDLVVINLSGGEYDISKYAREYDCDGVLIVYNRENMITADHLLMVR